MARKRTDNKAKTPPPNKNRLTTDDITNRLVGLADELLDYREKAMKSRAKGGTNQALVKLGALGQLVERERKVLADLVNILSKAEQIDAIEKAEAAARELREERSAVRQADGFDALELTSEDVH